MNYYVNKYYEKETVLEDKKTKKKYRVVETDLDSACKNQKNYLTDLMGTVVYYAKLKQAQEWRKDFTANDWLNWWDVILKNNRTHDFRFDINILPVTLFPIVYLSKNITREKVKDIIFTECRNIYVKEENSNKVITFHFSAVRKPFANFTILQSVNKLDKQIDAVLNELDTMRLKDRKNTLNALYEEYFEPLTWYFYYTNFYKYHGKDFVIANGLVYTVDNNGRFFDLILNKEVTTLPNGKDIKSNIELRSSDDTKKIRDYLYYNYLAREKNTDIIKKTRDFYDNYNFYD